MLVEQPATDDAFCSETTRVIQWWTPGQCDVVVSVCSPWALCTAGTVVVVLPELADCGVHVGFKWVTYSDRYVPDPEAAVALVGNG